MGRAIVIAKGSMRSRNIQERGKTMKEAIRAVLAMGLVWVLAGAPEALVAARREGAQLRVILATNEVVEGELIGVRGETLVMLTKQGDRTVGLGEVSTIFIKDKSGTIIGGACGLTAGAIVDASLWHSFKKDTSDGGEIIRAIFAPGAILVMVLIAGGGALTGMLIGHAVYKGKTYNVRGMTPEQTAGLMQTLRKKAMVPDYK